MSTKHINNINLSLNANKQRNVYIRHRNKNEQERSRLKREIENYFLEINKFTQYKTNNNNSIFIGKIIQRNPLPFLSGFRSVDNKGRNASKKKMERARSCEVVGGSERGKGGSKEWEWVSKKNEWYWNWKRKICGKRESVLKIIENKFIHEKMMKKYNW